MLAVYSEHSSPRLAYICDVLLRRGLQTEVRIFTEAKAYESAEALHINYSDRSDLPGLRIRPAGLLNERGLRSVELSRSEWKGMPCFFPGDGDLPFDLFSAAFYFLTRYEEYLPFEADSMGRFPAKASLAFREGLLDRPLVDEWLKAFHELLVSEYKLKSPWPHAFRFQSTIDIDSAFAYRHKGAWRTLGAFAKDLLEADWERLSERFRCLTGRMHDPYDVYAWLESVHPEGDPLLLFFLLADFGKHDKNVPHWSSALRALAGRMQQRYKVGIHPGVASNSDDRKLAKECDRLAHITGTAVTRSRQHYLMLRFPSTYQRLEALGIEEDHSLGFADAVGFRAGTSRPFPFYDLDTESQRLITLVPFCAMDATLQRYQALSPDEAVAELKRLCARLRSTDGDFRVLWHNESLSNHRSWKGWREVYEQVLKMGRG